MSPSTGKQIKSYFVGVIFKSQWGKERMLTLKKITTKAEADQQCSHPPNITRHLTLNRVKYATVEYFYMKI